MDKNSIKYFIEENKDVLNREDFSLKDLIGILQTTASLALPSDEQRVFLVLLSVYCKNFRLAVYFESAGTIIMELEDAARPRNGRLQIWQCPVKIDEIKTIKDAKSEIATAIVLFQSSLLPVVKVIQQNAVFYYDDKKL